MRLDTENDLGKLVHPRVILPTEDLTAAHIFVEWQ